MIFGYLIQINISSLALPQLQDLTVKHNESLQIRSYYIGARVNKVLTYKILGPIPLHDECLFP